MPTRNQPLTERASKVQARSAGVLEVTSPDQLAALAAPLSQWSPLATLSLNLPFVEAELQRKSERRLNFLRGVCGCQAGALFALAALAWSIAGPPSILVPESGSTPVMVLHAAAFVVGMGILGKALAIVAARAVFASLAALLVRRARSAERGLP
jgi:hypothetical protein